MIVNISGLSAGEILKNLRKLTSLSQKEFASKINHSKNWQSDNERGNSRFYMNDIIKIIKIFNFEITFKSEKYGIKLNLSEHNANDFLRFLRQATGKQQGEFASTINKSNDWEYFNEAGITNYYANDLFLLAKIHEFEVIILKEKTAS